MGQEYLLSQVPEKSFVNLGKVYHRTRLDVNNFNNVRVSGDCCSISSPQKRTDNHFVSSLERFFDDKPDQAGWSEFTKKFWITAGDALRAVRNRILHALICGFLFRMMDTFFHNSDSLLNIKDNSRSRRYGIQPGGICMKFFFTSVFCLPHSY
jgi:hypothetical protein